MQTVEMKLNAILMQHLKLTAIPQDATIDMKTIATWTSFNHIKIMLAIEKKFDIKIPSNQIMQTTNYCQLCALIKTLVPLKEMT